MLHEDFQFLLNFRGDLGAGGFFIGAALEVAEVFESATRDGDRPNHAPAVVRGNHSTQRGGEVLVLGFDLFFGNQAALQFRAEPEQVEQADLVIPHHQEGFFPPV